MLSSKLACLTFAVRRHKTGQCMCYEDPATECRGLLLETGPARILPG